MECLCTIRIVESGRPPSIQAGILSPPMGVDGTDPSPYRPPIHQLLVAALVQEFYAGKRRIVVPTYKGKRGHPVIFASSLFEELLNAPTERGARSVGRAHPREVAEVPTEEQGVILNLNDPYTLRRAMES